MRELDRLLAERCMGWSLVDGKLWHDRQGKFRWDDGLWFPTEDVHQAFICLDELRKTHDCRWEIRSPGFYRGQSEYQCRIVAAVNSARGIGEEASHKELPLAICLAILRALDQY